MTDAESLKSAISQYELQLVQVQQSLSQTAEGPDRENLISLQSDIQELIALTKESLQSAEGKDTSDNEDDGLSDDGLDDDDDPLAKEYAAFKAELEEAEQKADDEDNEQKVEDELKSVEGMKCQAPFEIHSGAVGYHNAIISSLITDSQKITDFNDIKVKVFFVNPTEKKMVPCSYFLDGSCKFSDDKCHFSHGEVVLFSSLQEYREPDFTSLKMGSRVLAKDPTGIWHRSIILKESDEDDLFKVKLENSGRILEAKMDDLFLIDDADLESDSFDFDENLRDQNDADDGEKRRKEELVHRSLMRFDSKEPLGKWEEHTRGIGSKLMAQMGYVRGTGLGKLADGRVNPVEAQILPAGKSLDHCMQLKENAGADEDLFSVEKRMQKQRAKLDLQRQKQYLRDLKKDKQKSVFQFINETLREKGEQSESKASISEMKKQLKGETNRNLNVAKFKTEDSIEKLEKETVKLKHSLSKHCKGSVTYNNIISQYNNKQDELCKLRLKLKNIDSEQSERKNKAKLSVF